MSIQNELEEGQDLGETVSLKQDLKGEGQRRLPGGKIKSQKRRSNF